MSRNIFKPRVAHIRTAKQGQPVLPLVQILQANQADQAAASDQVTEPEAASGETPENR